MQLVVLSVVAGKAQTLLGTETYTHADIPTLPHVGDHLAVPGHDVIMRVNHRGFVYTATEVIVELECSPLPLP